MVLVRRLPPDERAEVLQLQCALSGYESTLEIDRSCDLCGDEVYLAHVETEIAAIGGVLLVAEELTKQVRWREPA